MFKSGPKIPEGAIDGGWLTAHPQEGLRYIQMPGTSDCQLISCACNKYNSPRTEEEPNNEDEDVGMDGDDEKDNNGDGNEDRDENEEEGGNNEEFNY